MNKVYLYTYKKLSFIENQLVVHVLCIITNSYVGEKLSSLNLFNYNNNSRNLRKWIFLKSKIISSNKWNVPIFLLWEHNFQSHDEKCSKIFSDMLSEKWWELMKSEMFQILDSQHFSYFFFLEKKLAPKTWKKYINC